MALYVIPKKKGKNRGRHTICILIGWQAYRGDQMHRKNSPTSARSQIQAKKKKHLPGLYTFKTLLTADFGQYWVFEKQVPGLLET